MIMDMSEFAVETLQKYAEENQTIVRGTSDLSPMEEWLIKELAQLKEKSEEVEKIEDRLKIQVSEVDRLKDKTNIILKLVTELKHSYKLVNNDEDALQLFRGFQIKASELIEKLLKQQ